MHDEVEAYADAKAVFGIIQRTGIGKVRHTRAQALWLQACGREKRIQFHEILGDLNPADAFTKYLAEAKLNGHVDAINAKFEDVRSTVAPALGALGLLEGLDSRDAVGLQAESCDGARAAAIPPSPP